MKLSATLVTALLAAGSTVSATPLRYGGSRPLSARADPGSSYTVSGLGERKKALTSAGGTTLDMAIAMLETDNMGTDYAYGDNKSGDSANFGVFKQNWGLLRECASQFQGQSTSDSDNGAALNSDLSADVTSRHECESYYGTDKWFGGHRNGAAGLSDPNTDDINTYKNAVYWIQDQLESDSTYQTDDTRFSRDVTAI